MTWHRSQRDSRTRVSIDAEDIEAMRAAIKADREACPACTPGNIVSHMTGYIIDTDREYKAVTYRCPSFSRWYNPDTGQMEGHAHCTCDYCF